MKRAVVDRDRDRGVDRVEKGPRQIRVGGGNSPSRRGQLGLFVGYRRLACMRRRRRVWLPDRERVTYPHNRPVLHILWPVIHIAYPPRSWRGRLCVELQGAG